MGRIRRPLDGLSDWVIREVVCAKIRGVFDDAVIREAGRRILKAAPPGSRVILFGSHARGQAREHSDLDFLVIEPEVAHSGEESVRLHRALQRGVYADVIVVSDDEAQAWRDVYGTVIHAALSEGRPIAA